MPDTRLQVLKLFFSSDYGGRCISSLEQLCKSSGGNGVFWKGEATFFSLKATRGKREEACVKMEQ